MTVQELIEALKKLPQAATVRVVAEGTYTTYINVDNLPEENLVDIYTD